MNMKMLYIQKNSLKSPTYKYTLLVHKLTNIIIQGRKSDYITKVHVTNYEPGIDNRRMPHKGNLCGCVNNGVTSQIKYNTMLVIVVNILILGMSLFNSQYRIDYTHAHP